MSSVKRMVRIAETGRRLTVELPWCRDFPADFAGATKIDPARLQYRLTFQNQTTAEGPVTNTRIEVDMSGKKAGVYALQLMGNHTEDNGVREFWKQFLFIQPTLKRSAEDVDKLARAYAPIFLYSRKEQYFPVSLKDLLQSPALLESRASVAVDTVAGPEEIPIPHLDEFLRYNGHCDYLLNQSVFDLDGVFKEIHGNFRKSVVYYSYLEDQSSDRFFINYHTFYAFDPKTGIAKLLNIGPHVFDRESMTMVFRGDGSPEAMVLSGHLENQPILFLEKLKMWNTGRVRLRFPDESNAAVRNHPIVPVAEGSHALYPTAGLYHISLLTELAGHIFKSILPSESDDDDAEMDQHQALLPPSLPSDKFTNYDLRPLRLDLLTSDPVLPPGPLFDPAICCLVFSGYWVDVPGTQNERFPPFSRKEKDIEEWVDRAHTWDWKDLPASIVEHNKALGEYISKFVK